MLSKNAQYIQDFLKRQGIETNVVEMSDSTRTAEEAAKAIGCQVAQIVKSLIFRTKTTHRPILVLASGVNRVNEKKISLACGEELVKADADFTRTVTGFAIGGIPPVGHLNKIETYIDEELLQLSKLWAAAGTPHAVFHLDSAVLANLTEGKILAIK